MCLFVFGKLFCDLFLLFFVVVVVVVVVFLSVSAPQVERLVM